MKTINSKCSEEIDLAIKKIVDDILTSTKTVGSNGLLSGRMGVILFIAEYYTLSKKEKCYSFIQKELEEIFDDLNNGSVKSISLANGLTGILLGVFLLRKHDLIDIDADELSVFNKMLSDIMLSDLKNKKNDYLHSSLGILYYLTFTLKDFPDNLDYINNAIIEIHNSKKMHKNGFYWSNDMATSYDNSGINLGLSHGQAGMLSVLCYVTKTFDEQGIESSILNDLIKGIVNLFEGVEEDVVIKNGKFSFPDWIRKDSLVPSTRLAWCYGDLSTIYTLMKAANSLGNDKLVARCVSILLNTTTIAYNNSGVVDAGFCHGAAGVAYLYQKCYEFTKNDIFMDASWRWVDIALGLATHEDGVGGYKSFFGDKWMVCNDLLDGVSGIGLVLLSKNSRRSSFFLDNSLLLQ